MRKVLLYAVIAAIVYYFVARYIQRHKYEDYLKQLGFEIVDRMSFDEVRTSYIYLHDFARKYSANAGTMLKQSDPTLYEKALAISKKYQLFNLS